MDSLLETINVVRKNKSLPILLEIRGEMTLREDVGLDSLDLAELTARLYEEHGVDVFAAGLVFTVGEVEQRLHDGRKQ